MCCSLAQLAPWQADGVGPRTRAGSGVAGEVAWAERVALLLCEVEAATCVRAAWTVRRRRRGSRRWRWTPSPRARACGARSTAGGSARASSRAGTRCTRPSSTSRRPPSTFSARGSARRAERSVGVRACMERGERHHCIAVPLLSCLSVPLEMEGQTLSQDIGTAEPGQKKRSTGRRARLRQEALLLPQDRSPCCCAPPWRRAPRVASKWRRRSWLAGRCTTMQTTGAVCSSSS